MTQKQPLQFADVQIKSYTKKGYGLAHFAQLDGSHCPVEVLYAIPGDQVRVSLLRKKRGVYKGLLTEILAPSPDRIAARCRHFGVCGGCRWQQIPYNLQLQQKEKHVRQALQHISIPETAWHPILPCDPPWHYRNKMEFSFSMDAAGKHFLGLLAGPWKGKVLNLSECHLPNPWMAQARNTVYQWWEESGLLAYHPRRDTGALRTLTLREGMQTGDRMVILQVSGNPEYALHREHLQSFAEALRTAVTPKEKGCLSIFLRIQQAQKGSPTQFFEMLLDGPDHIREELCVTNEKKETKRTLQFSISPTAFFQPNTRQAEKLYGRALELTEIDPGSVVYDLYCGTGTLGLFAANQAKQVTGIELSPESALDARTNAKENGLDNVQIITGDVGKVLEGLQPPDVVMVDPPRAGLDSKALAALKQLQAKKILYISCQPKTQGENLTELCENDDNNYEVTAVQPVDQFPHTVHIENIVVLQRSES